ncbi:MAG TPA: histidine phosphatase family protein [Burkholderiaceae bacterium]|nr:histidine phosphatase family protein [Burkholderiaceae bacterium]
MLRSLARRRLLTAAAAATAVTAAATTSRRAAAQRAPEVPMLSMAQAAAMLAGGGHVLMMRHAATEPGVGDPPGYRLDDCRSQRNLSAEGQAQARAIGETLRRARVPLDDVRASQWCRCRDTAQLAFGEHAVWTPLNSFFDARGDERARHTDPVWALVGAYRGVSNPMLVTHQVNITAASGVYPAPGQIVALQARQGAIMAVFSFNPLS